MKKKKFITPTITRVKLDREQAVLQWCSDAPVALLVSAGDFCVLPPEGTGNFCAIQVHPKTMEEGPGGWGEANDAGVVS